ncbi:hypothetical protein EYZ11_008850 [Aspergillus tanneri]|nr:hypothetical protein EYZ11_008850 [Aspergillus tanneri]
MLYADGEENAFHVRATKLSSMSDEDWTLSTRRGAEHMTIETPVDKKAEILNGKIKAVVSKRGKITIYNFKRKNLRQEYA